MNSQSQTRVIILSYIWAPDKQKIPNTTHSLTVYWPFFRPNWISMWSQGRVELNPQIENL